MSIKWSEQVREIMCEKKKNNNVRKLVGGIFQYKICESDILWDFQTNIAAGFMFGVFFQVLSLCYVYSQAMLVFNNPTFFAIENDMGHRSYTRNVLKI